VRRREAGFPGLCAIVCGQQLSTASAAAIRTRLFAAFDPFHHDTVRRARVDKLKRLGLSAAKIKSIREMQGRCKWPIDLTASAMDATTRIPRSRAARHQAVDRRYLFAILSQPCRCVPSGDLAVRKPRAAQTSQAPDKASGPPKPGAPGAVWRRTCYGLIIMR
jgi:hypothetical protein